MNHADSSGRETPREVIRNGRWWSADVVVHTDRPSTTATFVLWAGLSGSDATKRVLDHLDEEVSTVTTDTSGASQKPAVGQHYRLDPPGAVFSELTVTPLSDDATRILEQTGNPGDVQLRAIQYDPES